MELSIFVAKLAALLYLGVGIAAIRGVLNFDKMVDDFDKSPALTFMTGFISLTLGMILIHYHNYWVKDWTVLITIIGWGAAVKGFFFMAFPETLKKFKGMYKNSAIWGWVLIIISFVFAYFGYMG